MSFENADMDFMKHSFEQRDRQEKINGQLQSESINHEIKIDRLEKVVEDLQSGINNLLNRIEIGSNVFDHTSYVIYKEIKKVRDKIEYVNTESERRFLRIEEHFGVLINRLDIIDVTLNDRIIQHFAPSDVTIIPSTENPSRQHLEKVLCEKNKRIRELEDVKNSSARISNDTTAERKEIEQLAKILYGKEKQINELEILCRDYAARLSEIKMNFQEIMRKGLDTDTENYQLKKEINILKIKLNCLSSKGILYPSTPYADETRK